MSGSFDRSLHILEFDRVLKKLAEFACFSETRNLILQIQPITNLQMVKQKIEETDEAVSLLQRSEGVDFFEVENPSKVLKFAQTGSCLTQVALLNIGLIMKQTRLLLNYFDRIKNFVDKLKRYFSDFVQIDSLENQILKKIVSVDYIADDASENLSMIRKNILAKKNRIKSVLNEYVKSSQKKYLQDTIISIKNGRYVLAVKSQFAGQVPGLVQDISASKATVFVEPTEVVNVCNDLKILLASEQQEIESILRNLTAVCLDHKLAIEKNYSAMIRLDLVFARAKLGFQMKATKPEISSDGSVVLNKARHPLIDPEVVVPIDVRLGGKYRNLIISGPNMGGKTVALKTIGLLSLMVMCGLLVPVSESSKISIFRKILVLVGDEQSIENSLSTFSAHIKNLVEILRVVDNKSLVLIDEICSGTDPQQGSALAISVVEDLCNKGACFAITTHYTQLKFFALDNEFMENASFEFDENLLVPTYRLSIGSFGQSSAFQISKKIGISDQIIQRARQLVSDQRLEFDRVIEHLNRLRSKYEKKLKAQQNKVDQLNELKAELELKKSKLKKTAQIYLENAKNQAINMLDSVRVQANVLTGELKQLKQQSAAAAADELNLKNSIDRAKSISKNAMSGLFKKFNFSLNDGKYYDEDYRLSKELEKGDEVLICDLEKKGVVLCGVDKHGKVLVEIGSMKTRVEIGRLRLIKSVSDVVEKKARLDVSKSVVGKKQRQVQNSVDLRGQTAMDAIFMLDRAIDSCVLSNVSVLTVIHGKGTGVLRKAVFRHLKNHTSVKTHRLGGYYEGGDGVTIVEL